MYPFMSREWTQACTQLLSFREELREKLRDFTATIKYYVEDQEGKEERAIELRIEDGELLYAGEVRSEHFDYEVGARLDVWKDITTGKIGPRFALITKKLKFKGDLIKVLKYEELLQQLLQTFSQIPTRWED